MDTLGGLRDAAQRARECAVMGDAVTLTRWIGTGRRLVMADRVLRKGREPFGLNEVNRRLAALGQEAA